jgi:hypothetical protein
VARAKIFKGFETAAAQVKVGTLAFGDDAGFARGQKVNYAVAAVAEYSRR